MSTLESDDVRRAVRQVGWLRVLAVLAGDVLGPALQRPGRHGPCPVHGGEDGFRLFPDVDRSGGGICATCGARPDGFALLRWLYGWTFPHALEQVGAVVGLRPGAAPTRAAAAVRAVAPPAPARSAEAIRESLRRTWRAACLPSDPAAEPLRRYLAARALDPGVLDPRVVRLHPGLGHWGDADPRRRLGTFPAMLALVADGNGTPATLHRTYLRADGTWKAPVPKPRKLMAHARPGPLKGAAVRLFPAGATLGLAEGLETALAVQALTGMPVWSCLSASLMQGFRPPPPVRRLVIWADRDRSGAGEAAAAALRDRLAGRLAVEIATPPGTIPADAKSLDWADVWLSRRCAAAA
jgi:phage/plasmid primase-like uncharacterized protein